MGITDILSSPKFIRLVRKALELRGRVNVTGIETEMVGVTALIYVYTESEEQAKLISEFIKEAVSELFNEGGRK